MNPATLRRHPERAKYDLDSVTAVFDQSFFAHVAFVDKAGFPQCVPMIALLKNVEEDTDSDKAAVYLHGHPKSALMELVKESAEEGWQPINVSVTATKGMYYIL
jgi:nitroimidazol reductase NimA-like FMN-containing flavoprotein (pyridoxamine 5'-phosphate oxidase superfamily)